jgi:glycosyltransferase involved in cell wall biosynthesis
MMNGSEDAFDNILIFNHDIKLYPPILSVVESLVSNGQSVVVVGFCSDQALITALNSKGAKYVEVIRNYHNDNAAQKLCKLFSYKRRVSTYVRKVASPATLLWIFGNENVWLLHSLVAKYKTVVYLFEVPELKISRRYRVFAPFANYADLMRSAYKVICCEYNRAHITKAYFGLKELPTVIPNKPEVADDVAVDLSLAGLSNETRKILLYQGIFNFPERSLEAFCESIAYLPDDYIVVLMGPESAYKQYLKATYQSERVKFVSFISPPRHLCITSGSYIGFLNYFSPQGDIGACLNTLYCAPNKIFEYSKFGVPMIGNDVPALRVMLDGYGSGICVDHLTAQGIADAVKRISADYGRFKENSYKLYDSVNYPALIASVSQRDD